MVEIRWWGHSCFEISGKDVTIGTDPFAGPTIGVADPNFSGDILLYSHNHPDDGGRKILANVSKDDTTILKWKNGDHGIIKGIKIKGIASSHDDKGGQLMGPNTIYVLEVDDIVFCHLGDLGHVLDEKQVNDIGKIDILLIPIGGGFTVGLNDVKKIVEQLNPKILIPCHYYFEGMKSKYKALKTAEDFTKIGFENVRKSESSSLEIKNDSLPGSMEVVFLKPPK